MYTYQQKVQALQKYKETCSITRTMRALESLSRETLYHWIREAEAPPKEKSSFRGVNTPEHPRHPPIDLKLDVLHRCFELGKDVKSVSAEIGCSRASIYVWRYKFIQKGAIALMNPEDDPRGNLIEGTSSSSDEINGLKAKMQDIQMQIDILKETYQCAKKDPGVDQTALRNQEKALIIDTLKKKYSLPKLLTALCLSRSCYYYQIKAGQRRDKYRSSRIHIAEVFEANHHRYGYRRIHAVLRREGICLSEKVIRRIIKQDGLKVVSADKRKYNFYKLFPRHRQFPISSSGTFNQIGQIKSGLPISQNLRFQQRLTEILCK